MKCLVVGGAGFISGHLIESLLASGRFSEVATLDNYFLGQRRPQQSDFRADATDLGSVTAVLESFQPNLVIDLSTKPIPHSLVFPREGFLNNVSIVANLLECYRRDLFDQFIYFSTSEIYGDALVPQMDESHERHPRTPYAASKAASEHLIQSYFETFRLETLVVRPFNNYGPGQNSGPYSAVLPRLGKWISQGLPVLIDGSGQQTRDFVFVKDTAEAILRLIECGIRHETINISTGVETSVRDLIALVGQALQVPNSEIIVEHLPERQGDVSRHCGDSSRLFQLTNWRPRPISVDLVAASLAEPSVDQKT